MMKTCLKCHLEFPYTVEFFYGNGPRLDRGGRRYLRPYCKPCDRSDVRRRVVRDPETARRINEAARLKYKYGITKGQRDQMLVNQDGKCAICERALDKFAIAGAHVDHCHKTGRVRGVLCHTCNKGIGYFRDDVRILARVIQYLQPEVVA